eukprot:6173032-Pleurochrysis_carterae.AAC.2
MMTAAAPLVCHLSASLSWNDCKPAASAISSDRQYVHKARLRFRKQLRRLQAETSLSVGERIAAVPSPCTSIQIGVVLTRSMVQMDPASKAGKKWTASLGSADPPFGLLIDYVHALQAC